MRVHHALHLVERRETEGCPLGLSGRRPIPARPYWPRGRLRVEAKTEAILAKRLAGQLIGAHPGCEREKDARRHDQDQHPGRRPAHELPDGGPDEDTSDVALEVHAPTPQALFGRLMTLP
jgi:hypothetical protein